MPNFEHYPVKEKLATDRDSQMAWIVREMGYSRDKTKGYQEKLVRLKRASTEADSVYGFMGGRYWVRGFRHEEKARVEIDKPIMVTRSLQAFIKVVSGLSDKVAFSFWLDSVAEGVEYDAQQMLEASLDLIRERAIELKDQYTIEQLMGYVEAEDFSDNPMGQAILGLHASYEQSPNDIESLRTIAVEGSAVGVLMFQAFADQLASEGRDVTLPQPGLSSGNIEPWVN